MNILLLLYILAAVGSFVELIAFRILVKRPRADYVLFFMACLISNLGYLALAVSRTLPEAVLANKLTYLGGIFLPFFMLQTIAGFCSTKLPKFLTTLLFAYSCVVFILVCTIGYSSIYYRKMALGEFMNVRYLWKTYGPAHILFPILLYTEIALAVIIVLRSIRKQKNVALRTTVMLLWGLLFSILAYVIERTFKLPVELVGFSYVIFAFFHMDHDDTVSPAVEKHLHHDVLHPRPPRRIAERVNVYLSRQLVDDTLITVFGIVHQVNGHRRYEYRDLTAGCQHFRRLVQGRVALAAQHVVCFLCAQKTDDRVSLPLIYSP